MRITRGLVKLLQERTADGYVFRTDLRLRPDPASTQIAVSTAAALDYYESVGQNWERAAHDQGARLRRRHRGRRGAPAASLSPFIWRKYLDFAAVADIQAMKRQIHAYRGHDEIAVEGHNIKLGRGGIREIEFFVQTQQLIAGGRHPELRGRETLATLAALAEGGWIGAAARDELDAAYLFLRTRRAPAADGRRRADPHAAGRPRGARAVRPLRRLRGPRRASPRRCSAICARCSATTRRCSRARRRPRRAPARLSFPPDADDRETLDRLAAMGFQQPLEASAHGAALARRRLSARCAASSRATPARRAGAAAARPLRALGESRCGAASPSTASSPACTAAARLFSLLRQNPDLVALIALVLGTAPRLADILAQFPDVDGRA